MVSNRYAKNLVLILRRTLMFGCLLGATASVQASGGGLVSGERIPVGGDGRGPLSAGLSNHPVGVADVFGGAEADLFLAASRFSKQAGLFLYRWLEDATDGTPVFGERIQIGHPGGRGVPPEGVVFQSRDGTIYGFWLIENSLVRSQFDLQRREFVRLPGEPLSLAELAHTADRLTAWEEEDGTVQLIFSVQDGIPFRPPEMPGWRTPEYTSFDGAGIWRGNWPYVFLYSAELAAVDAPGLRKVRQVSSSRREARLSHGNVAVIRPGREGQFDLLTGSWFGNFMYYAGSFENGEPRLSPQVLVPGEDGIALRHPSIRPTPVAWPRSAGAFPDLIAGGEGCLYFYRFEHFDDRGAPVYRAPVPVLEEGADLFPGSLPVLNVVDWDGDGVLDLVSGNSQGEILWFRNRGSNRLPDFLPGVRLEADGHVIQVQQGYMGIQGPQEARWGYSCPAVIDWNGNGLPDLLLSDATARHQVFLNRGTPGDPRLARGEPLYLEGLDLHGTWRVQPGAGRLGDRMAYVALDEDDQFRLYWKIDDFNVSDGGKLRLEDGSPIGANFLAAGGTGRLKIVLADWDGDGLKDLLVGTPRHASVPNPETGLPQAKGLPGASVLFLRNAGTHQEPVFEFPRLLEFRGEPIYFGQHACSPALADFGPPGGPHLLVGDQEGRIYFFQREDVSWGR